MRKYFIFILMILLSFTITSCKTEPEHMHTYSKDWSSDKTYHWHKATCEHTDEISDKTEHAFCEWFSNNDATTEHDGTKSRICSVCNYKETVTDEDTKIHIHVSDNGKVTKQPTCIEEGEITFKCTECDEIIKTEPIEKIEHTFGEYTYNNDATYDQDGTKTHVCSVCKYEETVPAKGPYTATYQFTDSVVIMPEDTSGSCGTSATYVLFGDFPQTAAASGIEFNPRPDDNGYYAGSDGNYYANYYDEYFIVEPIKWRVLDNEFDYDGPENTDTAKLLFAENAIMSGIPFWEKSYNGNPILNEIQFNNYKYSTIRAYLNGSYEADDFQQFTYENNGFLQTAFTASAQEKILTTYVVNDAASTSDDTGTLITADEYICGPTFDKIFLLSKKEVTTLAYGFNAYDYTEPGNSRIKIPTDYVKARGIVTGTSYNEEGAVWWLRSPCYYNTGEYIQFINKNGLANLNQNFTYNVAFAGIIPALAVKF